MNTEPDVHPADTGRSHRGFIYFCEHTLQYNKGVRAWVFFGPYLLGALWLEPGLSLKNVDHQTLGTWLPLLAYLVVFPSIWRALLLSTGVWKKKIATPCQCHSVNASRPDTVTRSA